MSEISVIIPTYNRAEHVTKAIDSVLAQTYTDYEIIVVDDGSTDNTKELLLPYMDRIRYIYQENAGVSAARNNGIRAASGRWIAFLDSDDIWFPDKLSRQMGSLARTGAKVCFTNVIWNSKEAGKSLRDETYKGKYSDDEVFYEPLELLFHRSSLHNVLSAVVIESRLLARVGCFDERISYGEDIRLFVRLTFETPFVYVHQLLVLFDRRLERERLTTDESFEAAEARCYTNAITRSEAYLLCKGKSKQVVKELRRQLGHYISHLAVLCCLTKNRFDAKRFALDGIYFGSGLRIYAKCFAVLVCPWFVRRLQRDRFSK